MAASLKSAHENSAGYDPAQIDDFAADVYLSGLTDEQKRNLLASLKDPGVREYLEVASNYARKNEALPDNIVVPKLLTLGNNGKYTWIMTIEISLKAELGNTQVVTFASII